jgi:hypothetical protein
MKQALAALLGAGLTAGACCALGLLLLDRLRLTFLLRRPERIPLSFALGAAALHGIVFVLLALRIAYWPLLVLALAVPIFEASRRKLWNQPGFELGGIPPSLRIAAGLCGAAFLGVYFIYAWAPEHSPDGSAYHLGLIARQLRAHGFEKITTNFYAMLGQGIELVYLPAFAIGRHSAAALTHLAFAVSLALSIFTFGRRLGKPWVGAAAALLTFLSPVFGIAASIAYIDAATAAVVFAAFYWLEIWDQERSVSDDAWRLLIPVGLLCGYAYAAKYTAFTIGLYALGFVAWRARRWKSVALVAACAALMAGPWVARNWLLYDNPVAPLGNWLFRNPYTQVMFERDYTQYLRTYQVEDKSTLPLEVTVRGEKTQGLIGPIFLLLPLGLFALRRRTGRHIWMAALFVSSTYLANIGTRFLIPSLPFFSLSIALALGETPLLLGALVLLHAALSWPTVIPRYSAEHAWRLDSFPFRAALRVQDADEFLRQTTSGYAEARMINANVPGGESVFTQGGVPEAYCERELLVNFQSASNEVASDIFHMGWLVGNQPIRADIFRFPETRAGRMRVRQTAQSPAIDQWNVHELRFFHKGVELARRPEWRLQAWPSPWDVGLAFDNSGATRWRSWETAAPGMYLDVDFGRDEAVDEVRVERSSDSIEVRMQPEVLSAAGIWEKLPARLESVDVAPNPNSRRMATYELHLRGIHYILLFDTDFGAVDVKDDPEAWGLKQVASVPGARLYKTTWP